jgi:hypothetical protein
MDYSHLLHRLVSSSRCFPEPANREISFGQVMLTWCFSLVYCLYTTAEGTYKIAAVVTGEVYSSFNADISLHADLKRALGILELLHRRWNNLAGFVKVVRAFIKRIDPSTEVPFYSAVYTDTRSRGSKLLRGSCRPCYTMYSATILKSSIHQVVISFSISVASN